MCFFFLCLLCLCACLFICALWSPAGKGLTSWLSFVVSNCEFVASRWYPGSGVVLDRIDSLSLHPYLLLQHGFRVRRSCETQLVSLIENLARKTSQGKQTDFILLDFSKAFDKVNHSKLTMKLHSYGIRRATFRWIQAFLGNRRQKIVVEGEESDSVPVTSGVLQGRSFSWSTPMIFPMKLSLRCVSLLMTLHCPDLRKQR